MRTKTVVAVVLVGVSFALSTPALADLVTENLLIESGDVYSSAHVLSVYDAPPDHTTVTMTGGDVHTLAMYDSSVLDLSGGYAEFIVPRDTASVDMSNGRTYNIRAYNSSSVSLSGGSVGYLDAYDSSVLDLSGGYADYIVPHETASVDMSNGETYNIRAYNSSSVSFSGGSVRYLAAYDSSVIDITGGAVVHLSAYDSSTINIYGQDLFLGDTYVEGLWLDGTAFRMELFNHPDIIGADTYSRIRLNPQVVPIPGAVILGILGLGVAGHRLRRQH